ncbi:MAG: DUF5667 domain-containing protein, partial [Candidatus Promineifilaceae bacterium]
MNTRDQADILDQALEEVLEQKFDWDLSALAVDGAPQDADEVDRMVAAATMVSHMPSLPLPEESILAADREQFLGRIAELPAPNGHADGQISRLPWLAQRISRKNTQAKKKEPKPMLTLLVKAALIVTIIISSLGGTAALSSATTLPGSPVYQVKLMLEETRLSMTADPAKQMALHLAFAQDRAQEMAAMAALDRVPDRAHMDNYRAHWREALQYAAELPDAALQAAMVQAQTMAAEQETMLVQAQVGAGEQVQERLQEGTQTMAHVQAALQIGLRSENTYRWRMQHLPEDWPGLGAGFGFGPGAPAAEGEVRGGFSVGPAYGPGDGTGPVGSGEGEGPYGPGEGDGPYGP